MTDASNSGWGALYKGVHLLVNPEQCLHINYLEMMADLFALKTLLPALKGHHVLETTPSDGSNDLISLREGRGRPLCLRRQLSLPNLFLNAARCPGPRSAQHLPVGLHPNCPASSGHQTGQGSQKFSPPGDHTLEEPDMVSDILDLV